MYNKVVKVKSLSKVDTTKFKEGTFFTTSRTNGILLNGKIEPLLTKADVKKMINDSIKKAGVE